VGNRSGLLVALEAGPEVDPQLAQAAEDAELIVEAEGEDVAVPAELHVVPDLAEEQAEVMGLGARTAAVRGRIEHLPAGSRQPRFRPVAVVRLVPGVLIRAR